MIERKFRVNLSEPVPKKLNEVALYESLIFALQRVNILFRPNSANAFLRIGVQGETMSFRSAAFDYLAL
ncbi:hypothetical protein LSS_13874 [Leptospira santarosai serovar Shermani str. LT 821]|uniref:Uncharacterized protein n=2 Tax=Leptospira santarosai TaxID=28183 RepID=K8XXE1_9LEPT|nr:hypothetical protein LSS_13874 [Leptospira santarosai serovar Shermani str. LT 821]EMN19714.1 hypothetical protein LEP1GSC063_2755 [Leptospira santarosai serovar Arenal str. MAVJ 401]EPG81248.1 hypothetical protein LEP1GSC048_4009 [Leptospira santarosai serovar Shermani str. 1342KT]